MSADLDAYKQAFGIDPISHPRRSKALELALDIRKFEITLYWQRATYFWALIAAAFAGYFAILAAEKMHDAHFNAFVVACIGFVFSLAWFLANRGSKFWQENWENHVDMLEDDASGPLYKTVLQEKQQASRIERFVDGPLPISVSRVNQWVSLFTVLIWPLLAWNVLPPFASTSLVSVRHLLVGGTTAVISVAMVFLTRSKLGGRRALRLSTREVSL
jgi:hypothetical protein